MGLEVAHVIIEHQDIYGRGVNLAARLMALAGPGEIIISAHVRDRLTPGLDADVEDLGFCFLRHISEPVRAYRIGPPGPRPTAAPMLLRGKLSPAIAVVPFAPRLGGVDRNALGDVIAEELIGALSHSTELSVISRLSTMAFSHRHATFTETGAHLNADYVLSGRYSADEHGLVLEVELAEAKSGRILWNERLKDRLSGILAGDQELIAQLVSAVTLAVISRELELSRTQPLPTLKSYTLLLGAIGLMHRLSLRDFEEARHLLRTVVDRSPRQAVPQAWLANWHVLRVQQGAGDRRLRPHQPAEAARRRP
jgi:TolB-like protein